jgi:hypothetical protein
MKTKITLEIDNVPEGIVLKILSRALDLYDFHHEEEMSESDIEEFVTISDSVFNCYTDWYANSGVMDVEFSMHPPSTNSEFDDIDPEDFAKWLIDSGMMKFNEDGSADLMSLRSPELILEQEKKAKENELLYSSGREKYNKFLKTLTPEEREILSI